MAEILGSRNTRLTVNVGGCSKICPNGEMNTRTAQTRVTKVVRVRVSLRVQKVDVAELVYAHNGSQCFDDLVSRRSTTKQEDYLFRCGWRFEPFRQHEMPPWRNEDALDLNPSVERRESSNLSGGTKLFFEICPSSRVSFLNC